MAGKLRYSILFLIYKNLQLKYKHSALGFLWSVLHPFFYLLIFLIIFSTAFPYIENYPLYVLSGLVFWIFFTGGTSQICIVFIKNAHIIKSLNLPKTIFPLTELGSELISFLLALIPFMVIMYFLGLDFSWNMFYLVPVIVLFSVFIFSVGLILGSLNVFFRDVGILWNTINPALFYFSPIAYSYEIIPEKYHFLVKYNPIYHFLEIIRDVLYDGRAPSLHYTVNCLIITGAFALLAVFIYRKTRNGFISNI
ncbi:MAG TPA: ABC transporter permease [Bacteroidales bacterium]|nr:ABC transporter permease [Bacteroidales bacterium]